MATTNAPSPRFLHGMAYDAFRNRMWSSAAEMEPPNNETYPTGLDADRDSKPPAREEMGVFDTHQLRGVVRRLRRSTGVYGDTWSLDGVDWTEVTRATAVAALPRHHGLRLGPQPDGLLAASTAPRPQRRARILGGEWTVVPPAGAVPPNTTEGYAGYDPTRGVLVLYGGFGPTFSDETWEFTGNNDGVFSLYGQACDLVNGTPELDATTPNIGTNLVLTASNLGASTGALWALGFSDQFFNGVPLPFDLTVIGLPGCGLVTGADVINVSLATNGVASAFAAQPGDAGRTVAVRAGAAVRRWRVPRRDAAARCSANSQHRAGRLASPAVAASRPRSDSRGGVPDQALRRPMASSTSPLLPM